MNIGGGCVMRDRCDLWVGWASHGRQRRTGGGPKAFLHFVLTGLLVGLLDGAEGLSRGRTGRQMLSMRQSNAAGVGLEATDLAGEVAVCQAAG